METKDKIKRIVARNPELKETLLLIQDDSKREQFKKILEKDIKKVILVGRDIESKVRFFELAMVMNTGYPRTLQVTTADLLDYYVNEGDDESRSLTDIVSDLVIIQDGRAFIPNKQKSNMIMQVFEQNERVIYYYKGTLKSYNQEHPLLNEYLKENMDIVFYTTKDKQISTGDEV